MQQNTSNGSNVVYDIVRCSNFFHHVVYFLREAKLTVTYISGDPGLVDGQRP